MSYTLWRGDAQVGYTVGEVSRHPRGTLTANIEMLPAYTLPSGFSQCVDVAPGSRIIDLIIDSPEDSAPREPPIRCPVHANADQECFLVREYTGPVEHPTASTAFTLRDLDDRPLDMALLWLVDCRWLAHAVAQRSAQYIPRFRLSAIFADALTADAPSLTEL